MNRKLVTLLVSSALALSASAKQFTFILPPDYPNDKITTTNGVIFGEIPYNTTVYEAEQQPQIFEIARRHYPLLASSRNLEDFNDKMLAFIYDIKTADGEDRDSIVSVQSFQMMEPSAFEKAKEIMGSRKTTNSLLSALAILMFASLFKRSRK